jgi:hypothetical protein
VDFLAGGDGGKLDLARATMPIEHGTKLNAAMRDDAGRCQQAGKDGRGNAQNAAPWDCYRQA